MCEQFFENIDTHCCYFMCSQTSLYASGATTGVVFDFGHSQTSIGAVYEGYVLPDVSYQFNFGYLDVVKKFYNLVTGKKLKNNDILNQKIWTKLTKKYCFVASFQKIQKFENSKKNTSDIDSDSDSDFIEIKVFEKIYKITEEQRWKPFEEYYKNNLNLIYYFKNSIRNSDVDIRQDLKSIFLAGGAAKADGFLNRLKEEIFNSDTYVNNSNILLTLNEKCEEINWIAASILASLSTFQKMYISKEEYLESGPSIVDRKCF